MQVDVLKKVHDCVDRITYKRDTVIIVSPMASLDEIAITISRNVECSSGSGKVNALRSSEIYFYQYLLNVDPEELCGRIYSLIKRFELHELDEWFKIDGKHYRDPHPELKLELKETK